MRYDMRTSNFLFMMAMLLTGIGFTACEKEDNPHNFQTASSSFTFSLEGLSTRNDGDQILPTEGEKTINNLFIGFYEEGACISSGLYSGNDLQAAADKSKYTVNNIQVPLNKQLTIFAVANGSKDYEKMDLSALKTQIVSYGSADAFIADSTNLVKVGELSNQTFTVSTNHSVDIPLTQLAAKIHVVLTMDGKPFEPVYGAELSSDDGDILELKKLFDNIKTESSGNIDNYLQTSDGKKFAEKIKKENPNDCDFHSQLRMIHNGKEVSPAPGQKWVVLSCDSTLTSKKEWMSWKGNPVTVSRIALESTLDKSGSGPTGILNPLFKDGILDFVFYTYQKNNNDPVLINIDGELSRMTTTTVQKRSGKLHGAWGYEKKGPDSGWGNGDTFFPAINDPFSSEGWGKTVEGTPSSEFLGSHQFNVKVTHREGLLPGHIYNATGMLKINEKAEVTVSWKVISVTDYDKIPEIGFN